jgi:hypothetical protein
MKQGGQLLLLLGVHLALTGLPGIAAALLAARRGIREVPVLLAIGLAATGIVAMLTFWAFYADPLAGESFAYLVLFGSILLTGWSLGGGHLDRVLLRRLATPLALWVLGSVFLVYFGFLHAGADTSLATSATRFSAQLPSDNLIPLFFAEWFFHHGHSGTPPFFPGEWLASDRLPLQVGYVMSQMPFGWGGRELHYQVLGVILQQLWIVGLWALLLAARVGRVTRALAMVTVLVSDIAIVNGFFVWPKMLPAAMLLAAAALLVTPLWPELRRPLWAAVLVAALLGLALLGHGASVFGVIPLALVAAFRGLPSWRWIGVALLAGFVLMVPWSAYQRYGDPPGDRLTKWMLGGVIEIDSRSSTEAILDSYRETGLGGTLHNKAENFVAIAGGGPALTLLDNAASAAGSGDLELAVRELRWMFFYYLLPSLGLLLIAPFAMAAAWRRDRGDPRDWGFSLTCWAVFLVGAVFWGLLIFGGSAAKTVIHQGTYLLPVLGLCAAVVGLRAAFPRFGVYFVSLSALFMLAIYVPALEPAPGTSYSRVAIFAAIVSLAGFLAVAFRSGRASETANTLAR